MLISSLNFCALLFLMVNCPYEVNYYNPRFQYDAALGNYLVNVHNLVFTIRGVFEPDQPNPKDIGLQYPFIKDPSAGRAHFEGLVIPANVVNGVIRPNIPRNYASMGSYHGREPQSSHSPGQSFAQLQDH